MRADGDCNRLQFSCNNHSRARGVRTEVLRSAVCTKNQMVAATLHKNPSPSCDCIECAIIGVLSWERGHSLPAQGLISTCPLFPPEALARRGGSSLVIASSYWFLGVWSRISSLSWETQKVGLRMGITGVNETSWATNILAMSP